MLDKADYLGSFLFSSCYPVLGHLQNTVPNGQKFIR